MISNLVITPRRKPGLVTGPFFYLNLDPVRIVNISKLLKLNNEPIFEFVGASYLGIGLLLSRHNSSTLRIYTVSSKSSKFIRCVQTHVNNTFTSNKIIIKPYASDNIFLFYYEAKDDVEIYSLLSLKIRFRFNIPSVKSAIKNKLHKNFVGLPEDLAYVSCINLLIVSCGSFVVGVDANDQSSATLLYDSDEQDEKDEFAHVFYYVEYGYILFAGNRSVVIARVTSSTLEKIYVATHEKISGRCRYLGWNPSTYFFVIARATPDGREDYYAFSYKGAKLKLMTSILGKVLLSGKYCYLKNSLQYQEHASFGGPDEVRGYDFTRDNDKYTNELQVDSSTNEEGKLITYVPDQYRGACLEVTFLRGRLLLAKPVLIF